MKGIIMAGGHGSRLSPMTNVVSKHLLAVYDKPMIYYPLSTLMEEGISEILIISAPEHIDLYKELLGNGRLYGIDLSYAVQVKPGGIAQAFKIGRKFIGGSSVCLILGDNIFHMQNIKLPGLRRDGASIFIKRVNEPGRFGVVVFDDDDKISLIEEKPSKPRSSYAVTGLYMYDNSVVDIVDGLSPSARGELEITDVNNEYLKLGKLDYTKIDTGVAWLDTGTPDSLLEASQFVKMMDHYMDVNVGCLERVAYEQGFISELQLKEIIVSMPLGKMRRYLERIVGW